ncbi:MAG: hypothetical protein MRJ65_10945 [Candidatus Brocadiaceae bacterium]|nr:hypothetical protein [Candidatus Brocadiaceae bacterium]
MCGIFGLVANTQSGLTKSDFDLTLKYLVKLSEPRGREAAGVAIASDNKISIYKKAAKPSEILKSIDFKTFLSSSISSTTSNDFNNMNLPISVIGHTRLVTAGTQVFSENNQPIVSNRVVGVHNGIIVNEHSLLNLLSGYKNVPESDSAMLFLLIDKFYKESGDPLTAVLKAYAEIQGTASVAFFCNAHPVLVLGTNTGSLYYTCEKSLGVFVFCSERYILEQYLQKAELSQSWNIKSVQCLKPLTVAVVSFDNIVPEIFPLDDNSGKREYVQKIMDEKTFEIIEGSTPQKLLRRCTRCIFPETYPFISFDSKGVCNYCLSYKKQKYYGRQELEKILERYRSKNGEPDCIVGFSGGRDSCYGLHILKTEFGMNPIAVTYDWGMVTDLARRNQARICGKLGVEHIIRAADIHKKRRHIRKNIDAWLRKPELGMVTLFMAGDKMFYHYGRRIRKETGVKLTVFCAGQQVEQMEFKIGFCGVNQTLANNTKLYKYKTMVKIRLAMWYLKQYLRNPYYINESLMDSFLAFYSSFIDKDDFLYLYYYIPWDEKMIEKTLKEEYDWEADDKFGKNQWRMGDGYTAFIDYIWYTVAGFSEYDNFRSNQIREGLITREEALELAAEDNKPRMETLKNFSQLIGFNLEEVLLKINAIPKLY